MFRPGLPRGIQKNRTDLVIEEPAKFEEIYQRHIAGWEKQIGENTSTYAAETIRDNLRDGSLAPFEISAELQQELKEPSRPSTFSSG